MDTPPPGRNNTLNLSPERLHALLDELDARGESAKSQRNHARLEFRRHAVEMEVYQPGGGSVNFCVACRNLSRGGMSVMHRAYMHVGTKCRIRMEHKTKGEHSVLAEVVQCRHVSGSVHDIGLRFAEEIDVSDYLQLDPLNETFSLEHVQASNLEGRILLVSPNEIDRKLVDSLLSDSSLRMVQTETYEDVLGQFEEPFDAVLLDFDADPAAAAKVIADLREAGHETPVIALSDGDSEEAKTAIREARANALVPRPIERVPLLRALGEFLLIKRDPRQSDAGDAPADLPTWKASTETLAALRERFAQDLPALAREIDDAVAAGEAMDLRYACARLCGTGGLLGHGDLAEAADKILVALDGPDGSLEAAREHVGALTALCTPDRSAA